MCMVYRVVAQDLRLFMRVRFQMIPITKPLTQTNNSNNYILISIRIIEFYSTFSKCTDIFCRFVWLRVRILSANLQQRRYNGSVIHIYNIYIYIYILYILFLWCICWMKFDDYYITNRIFHGLQYSALLSKDV